MRRPGKRRVAPFAGQWEVWYNRHDAEGTVATGTPRPSEYINYLIMVNVLVIR